MLEWQVKTIKDLGKVVTGKTPSKENDEFYNDGELPFVSPKDLDWNSYYVYDTQTKVTEKAYDSQKNQRVPKNSVFYTSLSFAIGKIGIASRESLTNQQIHSIVVNDKHDYKFVYYLLQQYRPYVFCFNSGIDTPIVPKSVFEKINVVVPELEVQKKIAAVLSAYDDLIENNKKRIQILENMAEELYKEWFVRFRFPNYENTEFEKGVPKDWRVHSLDELANYINGYPFKPEDWGSEGLPIIKIKELNNGICDDTPYFSNELSEKYLINNGDILFSWSGSLIVQRWTGGAGWVNQHLFKVVPNQKMNLELFFYHLKNSIPYLNVLTTGATMKHIKRKELKQVAVLVPSAHIQIKFSNFIIPLWQEIDLLSKQLKILINLKSDLLPRLISGKISVEELDIQFPPSMQEQ